MKIGYSIFDFHGDDLRLERLVIFYPGTARYDLSDWASVMPLAALAKGSWETVLSRRARLRASARPAGRNPR